jgi:hypothetical protein
MPLSKIDEAGLASSAQFTGFKNRIINGAMVIDQRNAGASVTPADGQYTLDRWSYNADQASKGTIQQNAGAVTPPAGFSNYLGFTSTSAYSVGASELFALRTVIEGFNFADMAFGSASASAVTMSFWVRSSLTGTFGGAVENNGGSRSYVFSYTISSANTWEYKTITIAGDTSGTWLTTNGVGLTIRFGLGVGSSSSTTAGSWSGTRKFSATGAVSVVGTNGATFYITGVQLEKGSTATSFDYRPYGTELALCQRYFCKTYDVNVVPGTESSTGGIFTTITNAGVMQVTWAFPVNMRAAPTVTAYNMTTGAAGTWRDGGATDRAITIAGQGQRQTSFQNFVAAAGSSINGHAIASIEL